MEKIAKKLDFTHFFTQHVHSTALTSWQYRTFPFLFLYCSMAQIGADCFSVFQDIKLKRKYRYVIFKIDQLQIEASKFGERTDTYEDFLARLPGSNCRYVLYDYEFLTDDQRKTSKLYLMAWYEWVVESYVNE